MRLPRMTTRRWMIAVAIVALLLAAAVLYWRHRFDIENAVNVDIPSL